MYSHLNAEMVRTNQAEVARAVALAGQRREVKEARRPVARSGKHLRRVAFVTAALALIGGTSDALAATSVHARTSKTFDNSRTSHHRLGGHDRWTSHTRISDKWLSSAR